MSLVEKVARALCEEACNDPDESITWYNGKPINPNWKNYIPFAEAAIEAMEGQLK